MRIDLHVHSNASDGTDDPAEVVRRARAAGQDVIALTDHDTIAGWNEAREAAGRSLVLVPGMELSCTLDGRSIHLLAYLFDPSSDELMSQAGLIRDDRVHRAKQMVARLNDLGAAVTWEQVTRIAGDSVVGRPHIARAMAESGVVADPRDAFTPEWIDDGGRAYVDRYAVAADDAIRLVRSAGGVPVLAHPRSPGYEVSDEQIAGLASAGLAGVEVFHPDHDSSERIKLAGLASSLSLVSTGGSDDHGSFVPSGAGVTSLGAETTPEQDYERLTALAGQS